jgi:hypothetical protein
LGDNWADEAENRPTRVSYDAAEKDPEPPSRERLKGFEPSTFCMASSSAGPQIIAKDLEIDRFLPRRAGEA